MYGEPESNSGLFEVVSRNMSPTLLKIYKAPSF